MKITTSLNELLKAITFPFGECSMINHLELLKDIQAADPSGELHHYNPSNYTLYTTDAWIEECKRLREIDNIKASIKPVKSMDTLMDDLTLALSVGDLELVKQIQQQIKERR